MNDAVRWSENLILADGDYIDRVAFDLIVNFERMLERRVPPADLARWIDCVALDGGLREGIHQTQVVLLHDHRRAQLDNFIPSCYATDLSGHAFSDHLGEFLITPLAVDEQLTTPSGLFLETLQLACARKEVQRIMIVAPDELFDQVAHRLSSAGSAVADKHITLFTMNPRPGGAFRQEILGFSLMSALGISSSEIEAKNPNNTYNT